MSDLFDFIDTGWNGKYVVTECKRALSPSNSPGADLALNPYGGCEHGCLYCYAQELTHTPWEEWRTVKVKSNFLKRLDKELPNTDGNICIGTVTDAYQPAESQFELTRRCVKKLAANKRRFHIDTKSDLVLRDADIIKNAKASVSITITTLDERIAKIIEPGAPSPERRLKAMEELVSEGIETYALVSPVLDILDGKAPELVETVSSMGVRRMYIDRMRERPMLKERMDSVNIRNSNSAVAELRSSGRSKGVEMLNVFSE